MRQPVGCALMLGLALTIAAGCGDDSGGASSSSGSAGGDGGGKAGRCDPADTCSEEGDFAVGGDIRFEGSPAVGVTLQTVADVAGIASASVDRLTAACRLIAEDFDAPAAERRAIAGRDDRRERMNAWCELAASAVGRTKGNASLSIELKPRPGSPPPRSRLTRAEHVA